MRVAVDTDACSGTGSCVRHAPGLLRLRQLDDGDVAEVVPGGSATEDQMWSAAQSCPWQALLLEADDGEIVYP